MDRTQYSTLMEAVQQIPDPRHPKGTRYAWPLLLTVLCAALAAGQQKVSEISDWVHGHGDEIRQLWPKPLADLPSYATLRRTLLGIDVRILERVLERHAQTTLRPAVPLCAQAIDGKTLRGTLKYGPRAATRLVSLVQHHPLRVLAQRPIGRQRHEITAVRQLLHGRNLRHTVITLDALLTQKPLAHLILRQHGDYLMVVKANQPELYAAIELLFEQPPWLATERGSQRCQTRNQGHGRFERRTLEASTWLNAYLDWPGVQQVLRRTCYRRLRKSGQVSREVTYGITSVSPERASVSLLEQFWRGHWLIENGVHYVRDETWGEDRCQVHVGATAQVLAALRNGIMNALRQRGCKNIAAALRQFAASPRRAFEFVGVRLS